MSETNSSYNPVGGLPYKVYTAAITQSGDGTMILTSGTLVIGEKYKITDFHAGDDFTNVGSINNNDTFIATGTTPTVWLNGSGVVDTSAPITTVLQNTLGDIIWSYQNIGIYFAESDGLFTENKTFLIKNIPNYNNLNTEFSWVNVNQLVLNIEGGNDFLINTNAFIEIRVYP